MSKINVIEIQTDAEYTRENIIKFLKFGLEKNYLYYEHNPEKISITPIDICLAATMIYDAYYSNYEYGPGVYVSFDRKSESLFNASLYFYESSGCIKLSISGFSSPKEKHGYLDLGYYIPMFLEMCRDFAVLSVNTNLIG